MPYVLRHLVAPGCTTLLVLLGGCGENEENRAPRAKSVQLAAQEDFAAQGALSAIDPEGAALLFSVTVPPAHGSLQLDAASGAFRYQPHANYHGADSFWYVASDGRNRSEPAAARITVENVNDAPVLAAISALTNSPETHSTAYKLAVTDADDDLLAFDVSVDDAALVQASVDASSATLFLTPMAYGRTTIHVTARDAVATSVARSFEFTIADAVKSRTLAGAPGAAVVLENTTEESVTFTLTHNDFPMFQSADGMVEHVRAMPPQYADEPFERKLWRFLRDNVYHAAPLSADQTLYAPAITINSLGWGFCGHVAAAYVELARVAGYEARIWGLSGHVVPEIRIGDRWQMFDPDLAVFYRNRAGEVAGVEELAADPSLLTSPERPIFVPQAYPLPYSSYIAQIYGTPADNYDGETTFMTTAAPSYSRIELPARATLIYPGLWTDPVVGFDGDDPNAIPHALQAALTTPAGWSGELKLPWMIWDIQGEGRIALDGVEFEPGSQDLRNLFRAPGRPIDTIRVISSATALRFVLFVNAVRYELAAANSIALTGKDVWGIAIETRELPQDNRVRFDASLFAKPVAEVIP